MSGQIEFLETCLAEDQAAAEAVPPYAWDTYRELSAHIARWDPQRALREVAAKRRLLSLATGACANPDCLDHSPDEHVSQEVYGSLIIEALSAIYAGWGAKA